MDPLRDHITVEFMTGWSDFRMGTIGIDVRSRDFSARASSWLDGDALDAFVTALGTYPIDAALPPTLETRTWPFESGHRGIADLRVEVRPVGLLGQLGVILAVRESELDVPSEWHRQSIEVQLLTTYERLRRFAADLAASGRGEQEEARVDAEVMA